MENPPQYTDEGSSEDDDDKNAGAVVMRRISQANELHNLCMSVATLDNWSQASPMQGRKASAFDVASMAGNTSRSLSMAPPSVG